MRQVIALLVLLLALPAQAEVFELFVTESLAEIEQGVTVYSINAGDREMEKINKQLKDDGVKSEEAGARYITNELKQALSNQAVALMQAARYQLAYFPALVIDGRYVIYGSTSTADYRRVKPNG